MSCINLAGLEAFLLSADHYGSESEQATEENIQEAWRAEVRQAAVFFLRAQSRTVGCRRSSKISPTYSLTFFLICFSQWHLQLPPNSRFGILVQVHANLRKQGSPSVLQITDMAEVVGRGEKWVVGYCKVLSLSLTDSSSCLPSSTSSAPPSPAWLLTAGSSTNTAEIGSQGVV